MERAWYTEVRTWVGVGATVDQRGVGNDNKDTLVIRVH